ncbi:MAG: hypothetical protein Q9192_007645 [Flavoplaca navasiana]
MVCVKVDLPAIIDDDDDDDDDDAEPTIKQKTSDSVVIPISGAKVSSGKADRGPPRKKQKVLNQAMPIDLDSAEEAKTEGNLDRPQRLIKPPKIYGLYRDDGRTVLD